MRPHPTESVIPAHAGIHWGGTDRKPPLMSHSRARGNPLLWGDMPEQPAVYILASKRNGTLYVGVTGDLVRRVWEHKQDLLEGFTRRYRVHQLVYFELHADMAEAILRERRIKKWNRAWKIELIEKTNPQWNDLWLQIL